MKSAVRIAPDKLRAEIRKLGSERVFRMLDDAIELLPPAKLHKLVKKHIDLWQRLLPLYETHQVEFR